ncbi:peptidase [Sphingobacterium luzhongxinii]|uniref:peptidase n=1 Tax=Sphingobacterium luzhongxinii TaxID=2654181 RepID=UPI0013DAD139|nr:peptidase [Sphingobacterium sp. xlx-73]
MAKKSFILNDEREKNSYGFYVPNNKILLARLKKNGVMLYMHKRGEVCGRWENLRIEGPLLLGDPVFDVAIERYAEIAGQVERGFLNGASLYLNFNSETKFVEVDGRLELHNSEAFEGSIVDIPSNSGSLKLFAEGKELGDDEIKSIMLSASNPIDTLKSKIKIEKQMSNLKLNAKAMTAFALAGITPGDTEDSVSLAIAEMGAALTAEKTAHGLEKAERERLEGIIKTQQSAALSALLDQAVTDGQILGDQKETFAALGFDGAKKIIEGLPKKVTLGGQVGNTGGGAGAADPKTKEEFFKLSTAEQLAFKNSNEASYKALFA